MSANRWSVITALSLLMLLGASRALAQEIDLSGQIRPRFEGRDLLDVEGDGDEFVSMRTRLGVAATISPALRALAQVQDVRTWGGEISTTDATSEQIDVHQAWAELGRADATTLRIGRQEARYGAERLIGALDWFQQGRAFDGLRVSHPLAGARVDGFWFRLADETSGVHAEDATLAGAYAAAPFGVHAGEVFALWNDGVETGQLTTGGRILARFGRFGARIEGAGQFGERLAAGGPLGPVALDVSAHLISGELGFDVVDGVTVSAMYDRLSGDDDPADDEVHVFDTLFGTNHKFYGFADVFTNIPAHTGGRGLQDLALKGSWRVTAPVTITLDVHRFSAAAGDGMADERFGDEADLVATWRHSPNLAIHGGLFYFAAADGMSAIARADEDLLASYLTLDVTF